jgi:hypothetical protein
MFEAPPTNKTGGLHEQGYIEKRKKARVSRGE